ncbi:hypothetical protein BC834DRAFT_969585 [Gloeopeniophorella convolvens]|nr:hypothetical protein BC834DRAFT_969585 [Gloeopeniophorella convolvens]
MSCRRNDRARFVGCHVGAVRVGSCGKGCCGNWGPEGVEARERYNYLRTRAPRLTPFGGNTACRTPAGRAKRVCTACRHAWKPAHVAGNEYMERGEDGRVWDGWVVRPCAERLAAVWRAARRGSREARRAAEDAEARYAAGGWRDAGAAAYAAARARCPELWWRVLEPRCPGCGGTGVAVGSTFRAPGARDDKGWARVERMLDEGEKFSYCMTEEEEEELQLEVDRVVAHEAGKEAWAEEKRQRLENLGLAPR